MQRELDAFFQPKGKDAEFVGSYVGGEPQMAWHIIKKLTFCGCDDGRSLSGRLQNGTAKVDDCALIIFDECHSATKRHSYNIVNQEIKRFAENSAAKLPQIVEADGDANFEGHAR